MNWLNSNKPIFRKYLYLLILIIPFLTQCKKEPEMGLSLALNSKEIHLAATAGKTNIMVYSDGNWKVQFKEQVDWVSINKMEGVGNSDLIFTYSENYGASRSVTLILSKDGESQEVLIIQQGLEVALRFSKTRYTMSKKSLTVNLPIISNLKYDFKDVKVDYLYDDETSEKWITNVSITKDGYTFDALENNAGRKRSARVYINLIDGFGKEYSTYTDVDQTLEMPFLVPAKEESRLTRNPKTDTLIVRGNVGANFPSFEKTIRYVSGSEWIESVRLENDSLLIFSVRGNPTGLDRSADINLNLSHDGSTLINLTHRVFQSAEDYEYYTFEQVRNLITASSGEITMNAPLRVLQGIVISDAENPNMETNPNLTFNSMDLNETYKTAYVQSLDGKYGFRLKFNSQAQNTLKLYSKVSISLDGLTLLKEANPGRYTIKGLTGGNIAKNENGTASQLVNKTKAIAALTDADIYTHVNLTDVAISVPYGSYANVNSGYTFRSNWNQAGATTPYTDAIPTSIHDEDGSHINILVNTVAPWSRKTLPKGSGKVSGIIVHSKLIRYGVGDGNIGKYAIRPLVEEDIQLNGASKANTIAEWNWIKNGDVSQAGTILKDGDGNVLPAVGQGKLYATVPGSGTGLGAHPIYHSDPASKAVPSSAMHFTAKWWNAAAHKGEGFVFNFSTEGISGKTLLVNFTQGGGSGSAASLHVPAYWEVEYSLDGVNFTILPNSTYGVRPLAGFGLNHNYTTLGLISHSFKLPVSLLNKKNVYIKLKAQSNICGTNSPDGAESGQITSTTNNTNVNVRIGVVSFKYIQ